MRSRNRSSHRIGNPCLVTRITKVLGMGVVLVGFFSGGLQVPAAFGVEPDPVVAGVETSLGQLERWLGTSPHGASWNKYLKIGDLRAEIGKEEGVDRTVVARVLKQFQSGAAGLDRPKFAAVRQALAEWSMSLSLATPEDLSRALVAAKEQFAAPSSADVKTARGAVVAASRKLNRFLGSSRKRSSGWKAYLKWNTLQKELASDAPNLASLNGVLRQLSSDQPGLELSPFVGLRRNLRRYIDTTRVAAHPDKARKQFEIYVDELVKQIPAYSTDAVHRDSVAIGKRLGFLQRMGQEGLTHAVRRQLSHANLRAYVSSDLVAAAIEDKVSEPITINENILGTQIVGKGHTTGQIAVHLVPDGNRGVIELQMTGVTKAKTTGYNRGVSIYTRSTTELKADKRIVFTQTGFALEPTKASASTSTTVDGLSHRSRFVERIAWRKVGEQKGSSEREGSRRAERKLSSRIDEQVAEQTESARTQYLKKFRNPLLRRDAFPGLFDVVTTAGEISITLLEATSDQLGAPAGPADVPAGSDMALRLHESLLNNFAAISIGGTTFLSDNAPEEVVEQLKKLVPREGGRLEVVKENKSFIDFQDRRLKKVRKRRLAENRPMPSKVEHQDDNWFAVTLAKRNPVTVEFRDGTLKFTIRGTRFLGPQGDDARKRSRMSIWAEYAMEKDKYGGVQLTLKEWDVTPTVVEEGKKFDIDDATVREKLRKRMKPIFEGTEGANKIVEIFPLQIPGDAGTRIGELIYSGAEAKDGWLTATWKRTKNADKQAVGAATSRHAAETSDAATTTTR